MGCQKVGHIMISTSIYASEVITDKAIFVNVFRECLKAAGMGVYVIRGIESVINMTTVCDFMQCRLNGINWNGNDYYTASDLLTKLDDDYHDKFDRYYLSELEDMFGEDMASKIDDAIYAALRMTCNWVDTVRYRYVELSF